MTVIRTNNVHLTDSGNPNVKVQLGADTPSTMQNAKSQYDSVDVYCFICFTPFSNQENTGLIADNYRGTRADGSLVQNQKLYFPHTKYVNENCGKHNGTIRINAPLFVYCPTDLSNYDAVSFSNLLSIKLAEDSIKKVISYNSYYQYTGITLHLAIYYFTSTEEIANQFLNESYPSLCELYNEVGFFFFF